MACCDLGQRSKIRQKTKAWARYNGYEFMNLLGCQNNSVYQNDQQSLYTILYSCLSLQARV
jgi:hypothetical protein